MEKAKIIKNGNVNLNQTQLFGELIKETKLEDIIVNQILDLINQYPNDAELGRELRKLYKK